MSKQRPTLDERLQSLQEGFFGRGRDLKEADPIEPTPMLVTIDKIKEYDRNPRHERNEAYDLIKASIRQRGYAGALPITRRPGEPLYMVADGGNTVLHILQELYAETGDPKFHTIHCLFDPWISESETLIAHLIENDARGELLFIDRARAVRELRELLEQETGQRFSTRDLTAALRARGYTIDPATLSRMDYAVEVLFPVIPVALRNGVGPSQIDRLRKLDKIPVTFLEHRRQAQRVIEEARGWFLTCLERYDSEHLALEPVRRELEAHLAEICGESIARVRADFDFIEQHGAPGPDAPPALTPNPPEARPKSPRAPSRPDAREADAGDDHDEAFEFEEDGKAAEGWAPPPTVPGAAGRSPQQTDLPQDVKSLRGRMWTLATQLAQRHGVGECILTCAKGCGFLVDLPEHAPFAGEGPASAEEVQRVTLWWMLAGLADEWPHGPGLAPALSWLEQASIYPAIKAVAEGDEITPTRTLVPRVGYPPSLAIAPRELLAALDDRDYERLVQLIDARRGLQAHCRRLGKQGVWDV